MSGHLGLRAWWRPPEYRHINPNVTGCNHTVSITSFAPDPSSFNPGANETVIFQAQGTTSGYSTIPVATFVINGTRLAAGGNTTSTPFPAVGEVFPIASGSLTMKTDGSWVMSNVTWDGKISGQSVDDADYSADLAVTVTEDGDTKTANATATVTIGSSDISVNPEEFEPAVNETTTLTTHFSGAGLTVESVVRSEAGEVVKTYPAQPSDGAVSLVWDGRSDAGAIAYGNFTWEVTGHTQAGPLQRSASVFAIPPPTDLIHIDGVNTLDMGDEGGPVSKIFFDADSDTDGHIAMTTVDVADGGGGSIQGRELIKARASAGTNVTYLNMMFRRRKDAPSNSNNAVEYLYQIRGPRPSDSPAPTQDNPDPSPKGDTLANVSVTFGPGEQILVQGRDFEDKKIRLHLPRSVQVLYRLDFWAKTRKQKDYKLRYTIPSSKRSSDGSLIETGSGNISVTLRDPIAPWDDQEVYPDVLLRACKYATGATTDSEVKTGSQHRADENKVGLNHNLYMWLTWKNPKGYRGDQSRVKWIGGKLYFDYSSFLDEGGDAQSTCAFAQIHYAALGVPMRIAKLELGNERVLKPGETDVPPVHPPPGWQAPTRYLQPLRSLLIRPWNLTPAGVDPSAFPANMQVPAVPVQQPTMPPALSLVPEPVPEDLTNIPLSLDYFSNWQHLGFYRHYVNFVDNVGYEATFATVSRTLIRGTAADFGFLFYDPGHQVGFSGFTFTVDHVK